MKLTRFYFGKVTSFFVGHHDSYQKKTDYLASGGRLENRKLASQ